MHDVLAIERLGIVFVTEISNPYDPPASVPVSSNRRSVRRLQSITWLIVLGIAIATGTIIAFANLQSDDSTEDRRDVIVFFVGLAVIFGTAGSYLTCRYIAGNIPAYFIAVALGLFVAMPLLVGGPNYTGALALLSLIAAVSLVTSLTTGLVFRRMLR
ncbi:hypothetical protein Poly51_02190 [Rubripirellula tenax]|uniref:Uncharacterized protein n=1 Tax=Rubripirellula tenax TaxID=2528015 RepID=A0A5C6FDR6_9BACT|nr:hypothetical protein [Rubripirellula tenax]TWU59946.1 hypothetical protein Poly51_02190 [Rubripirellula tenax]